MSQVIDIVPFEFKTPGRGYVRVLVDRRRKYGAVAVDTFPSAYHLSEAGNTAWRALALKHVAKGGLVFSGTGTYFSVTKVPLTVLDEIVATIKTSLRDWLEPEEWASTAVGCAGDRHKGEGNAWPRTSTARVNVRGRAPRPA